MEVVGGMTIKKCVKKCISIKSYYINHNVFTKVFTAIANHSECFLASLTMKIINALSLHDDVSEECVF